jgi:hypothetical protein
VSKESGVPVVSPSPIISTWPNPVYPSPIITPTNIPNYNIPHPPYNPYIFDPTPPNYTICGGTGIAGGNGNMAQEQHG